MRGRPLSAVSLRARSAGLDLRTRAECHSGINFIDNYQRSGLYKIPLPFTLGQDAVGTLVHVPEHMEDRELPKLKLGTRVLVTESQSYAEYMTVPWWRCIPLPDELDGPHAIAMATSAYTAMYLVKESYELKKGDWALVRAAAGAAGLCLIQVSGWRVPMPSAAAAWQSS